MDISVTSFNKTKRSAFLKFPIFHPDSLEYLNSFFDTLKRQKEPFK